MARRQGNGFENSEALLKWENAHWKAGASWKRRNRGLPLPAPGIEKPDGDWIHPGTFLDTRRWDLSLSHFRSWDGVDWELGLIRSAQDKIYDNGNSNLGGLNVSRSEYGAGRTGISLSAKAPVGQRHFLEFIGERSDESLHVDGDMVYAYLDGISEYDSNSWSLSLQDTIALDRGGSFLAIPSIRWHEMDGEDKLTWQIALTKELPRGWMFKSAYGTYSRAPNMYEKYGDGAFVLPPADSQLKWETGTQLDLGVMWNGEAKLLRKASVSASLSGFRRETDNLIEFLMLSPRYARYANIARGEVEGAEAEAALDWEKWGLSFSGTWMRAINKTPDDPGAMRYNGMALPNRPKWSASARLTRKFRGWAAFAEYEHIGKNFADASEKVLYDAISRFNFGVKLELSRTARLTLGINDAFDGAGGLRMRPNGLNGPVNMLWYPLEGRSCYLTLNMEL
jgi:outer membrane receptor protein involved in Fe transport